MAKGEPKITSELNARQAAFVREYLVDRNATQAALRAGYSAKSAASQAHELLKNPKIAEALEREESALASASKINAQRFVRDWHELRNVDIGDIANVIVLPCGDCWNDFDQPGECANAECPTCKGLGVPHVHVNDTRKLTRAQRRMIKSLKMGKYGPEISFHDPLAFDDRIVKLCGLEPKQPGTAENPLQVIVQQMMGNALPVKP